MDKVTRDTYISNPLRCPWCKAQGLMNYDNPGFEHNHLMDIVVCDISCAGCNKKWTDYFRLHDLSDAKDVD